MVGICAFGEVLGAGVKWKPANLLGLGWASWRRWWWGRYR